MAIVDEADRLLLERHKVRKLKMKHDCGESKFVSLEDAQYRSRKAQWEVMKSNVSRRLRALAGKQVALEARLDRLCCPIAAICISSIPMFDLNW